MHRPHATLPFRSIAISLALALALAAVAFLAPPAHGDGQQPQAFHLIEITKIMAGYQGDTDIQAVEMKMITAAENLVAGTSIAIYDGNGVLAATLGTFAANLPNALAGDNILCATAKFRDTFGIIPDMLLTPGIPLPSGQVVFEKPTCRINAIPYGAIATPLTSPTVAPTIPTMGATALVRTVDNGTIPSCPQAEDAAARFQLRSGSPTAPLVFRNNARQSVNVFSTVTDVETRPSALRVRAYPNPFHGTVRIQAPDWSPLTIHDLNGRLVRVLTCAPGGACPDVAGPFQGYWDGTDLRGNPVPSGIYFLRHAAGIRAERIALLR